MTEEDKKQWTISQMKAYVLGLPAGMNTARALVRRVNEPMLLTEPESASLLAGWYLTQGYVADISLCGGSLEKLAADLFDTGTVELITLTVQYETGNVTMNVAEREIKVFGKVVLPKPSDSGLYVEKLTLIPSGRS